MSNPKATVPAAAPTTAPAAAPAAPAAVPAAAPAAAPAGNTNPPAAAPQGTMLGSAADPQGAAGSDPAKPTDPPVEGQGTGGQPKGDKAAPAPLEVQVPEGFVVDEARLGEFTTLAQKLGLDSEKAQELMDFQARGQNALVESTAAQLEETRKGWLAEIESDTEIGGANLARTKDRMQQFMVAFGTPELKKFLNETGLGDHTEMVRLAERIGARMTEKGATLPAGSASGGEKTDQQRADAHYDHPDSKRRRGETDT